MGIRGKSTALRCILAGLLVLLTSSVVLSQEDDSPGALLKESLRLMDAKKYSEAISTMYRYLEMVEGSDAGRVIEIAQGLRFKLARILIEENRLDEAAEVLEVYISIPQCKYPRQGRKMLATCYYESGKPDTPDGSPNKTAFEKCVGAIRDALEYNENPIVMVQAVASDDNSNVLEMAKEDDPEYTKDELILLNRTLGEALYGLKQWDECIDPFTYVIDNSEQGQNKGYAIMKVINALIEIPDFARINAWIPKLYRTEARYDIRVNLALMNVAAALYDARQYDSALPLYRMILPRDTVIDYQRKRLRELRIAAGMPPEKGMEVSPQENLLFPPPVVDEAAMEGVEGQPQVEVKKTPEERKVLELENLIAALEGLPAYENNIAYRIAQLYQKVDRYWEAVRFFDAVYVAEPTSELGERAIADVVSVLLENLDELELAKGRAFDYMKENNEGAIPRQIAYILTGHYYKNKNMEEMKAMQPYIENLVRTNAEDIVRYDAELYFMQGVADLMLYKYEDSEKSFKRVLDEFPGSHQEGNALYWYGSSKLYLQKYTEALPVFDQYIEQFPEGDWIDEAYFQGGISLFGMEDYIAASNRFTLVIDTFPDSGIFPNACSMRGDLRGAQGNLEIAIEDYTLAVKAAVKLKSVKQATYATFKIAEINEAWAEAENEEELTQKRYDDLIAVVQDYLDTWEDEADIAKALYWIGKTKIQKGLAQEAVATYLDAIVRFGSDIQQDGVDMMIAELVKISAIWLGLTEQAQLKEDLRTALASTDNLVLQLRLRVAMAKLDYSEVELGKQLIKELPDLKSATPPVLATICEASFDMKDYSRAKELLNIFITQFEESDYMRAAFKLRAYGQLDEKDFEGAMLTIQEAQETYGHDRDVVWAQLMLAQILYEQGELEEARVANMYVKNIPEWRGEPVAQAQFQLGLIEEKAGDPKKAFDWFQRTYVQYKGYAGGYWAAESYVASARCLEALGLEEERINTYRNMLYSPYVNDLPQAEVARKALGSSEVAEIESYLAAGGKTNLVVMIESDEKEVETEPAADAPGTNGTASAEAETTMEKPSEEETDKVGMEDAA